MSINPRFRYFDNTGVCPCLPPLILGRLLDKLSEGRAPSIRTRVAKALAELRRKLAH